MTPATLAPITNHTTTQPPNHRTTTTSPWELAAEAVTVKIRWFGLLVGYVLVNVSQQSPEQRALLNALLTLGAGYTVLDTWYSLRGQVFLGRHPLIISGMEALFIALLCFHDTGLESAFRYYYFLSLICCAVRHTSRVTYVTCALHCGSYLLLYTALPLEQRATAPLALTLVMLGWVTWASNALAVLLKRVGDYLGQLNDALRRQQADLEARISERTRQLQEAQAHVLHQEKMAAFGLLAAGIAHEVGNPLTSISSMVELLQRHEEDPYVLNKLTLMSGQLQRIRTTLRELIEFSRPACIARARIRLGDILREALNIARYYKRTRGRIASPELPADLPPLVGVRDQLVQVFLNLILNAIDAVTSCQESGVRSQGSGVRDQGSKEEDGGRGSFLTPDSCLLTPVPEISLAVRQRDGGVEVSVRDQGCGIRPEQAERLFQPYFTTKKHGTGLGLFVTRRLVSDHGGTVDCSSVPGQGTTFRVWLPLSSEALDRGSRMEDRGSTSGEVATW
jgi:signal transduction histidine kinase